MQPLSDLAGDEVDALLSQIRGWEGEMKTYKGWHHWGRVVEDWCESQIIQQRKDDSIVEDGVIREKQLGV